MGSNRPPGAGTDGLQCFLQKLGFRQSDADPCLFIMKTDSVKLILALYVDDGLVAATDDTALSELVQKLRVEFKITVKPVTYFLRIEIDQQ